MTEHFENLWEKAEVVSESYYDKKGWEAYDVISELQENLVLLRMYDKIKDRVKFEEMVGKVLFNTTYISKKYNVNTYIALKDATEDIKIEMLDPDIDNTDELSYIILNDKNNTI